MINQELPGLQGAPVRPTGTASRIRDNFKEYVNGPGALAWQENMI